MEYNDGIAGEQETNLSVFSRQALHIDQSNNSSPGVPYSTSDMVFPESTRSQESFDIASGPSASFRNVGSTTEPPNFGQYQMLIGSLLLTTLMAVGSALDAKYQCIDQEMYTWMLNYIDDDNGAANNEFNAGDDIYTDFVGQEGRAECLDMFRYVIIPV